VGCSLPIATAIFRRRGEWNAPPSLLLTTSESVAGGTFVWQNSLFQAAKRKNRVKASSFLFLSNVQAAKLNITAIRFYPFCSSLLWGESTILCTYYYYYYYYTSHLLRLFLLPLLYSKLFKLEATTNTSSSLVMGYLYVSLGHIHHT